MGFLLEGWGRWISGCATGFGCGAADDVDHGGEVRFSVAGSSGAVEEVGSESGEIGADASFTRPGARSSWRHGAGPGGRIGIGEVARLNAAALLLVALGDDGGEVGDHGGEGVGAEAFGFADGGAVGQADAGGEPIGDDGQIEGGGGSDLVADIDEIAGDGAEDGFALAER